MSDEFQVLWEGCMDAVRKTEAENGTVQLWNISPETYRQWIEQLNHIYPLDRGNAKVRRRWRRRNLPNTQRMDAIGVTLEDPSEAWEREDL